jgi:alpha-tubulin suppressor-like RCC1 family protein
VSRDEGASKLTGYTAVATDSNNDSLTFSLSAGADKALFAIDATSGLLSFVTAPDFEQPADANLDNVYEVEVTVVDGKGGKSSQLVMVAVKNVNTRLTALSKSMDTELIPGNTVTAQSSCDGCDPSLTKYEWYVEGADTAVSTTASYKIKSEDRFKKITIKATPYTTSGEIGNTETVVMLRNQVKDFLFQRNGFVVLRTDGTILIESAGDVVTSSDLNLFDVKSIHRYDHDKFVVLKNDDSLVYDLSLEGKVDRIEIPNIDKVYDGAALSKDHKLYAWGYGIGTDELTPPLTNIVDLANGAFGIIAAVSADGNVVTTTYDNCGGALTRTDLTDIVKVGISLCVFAGVTDTGTVKVWGGSSASESTLNTTGLDLTNVVDVFSNYEAFAALKADGNVVAWGDAAHGGDSGGKNLSKVSRIFSNRYAFAAIKTDGTVVSWGDDMRGGDSTGKNLANVVDIVASEYGFAAIKADGNVTAWGSAEYWVMKDYTEQLNGVVQLLTYGSVFVALQDDGTVTSLPSYPNWDGWSKSSKADFKDVVKLFGDGGNLAALKNNGEVFSWGSFHYGGNVDGIDLAPFDEVVSSSLELNP